MNLRELSKLFYQLKLVNQELTTKFEKATGLSLTRYELMLILNEKGPCSQTVLQNELKIDSAAVTRHLKVLEEKKYVTRERNKENNREVFVAITPTASQALAKCESEYASANLCTQLPLNAAEQKTLLELLTKLSQ
ncbi:MarR family winged helix-turn-helix transcriptional regulator [Enterococcus lemanii]|jgi:DNA-binding MarR family transcriptional regulator|uniref:MarR family winged helix-turn-helix transcriptional regulator n=1 Tax=Enterococcus lemanii TaxID=1159752 RepID=A0ABV9MUZ5_9ENTE|nr:MarR family transcriptional regulator [Enterococcus lemanii]MBM7710267.1 DNA-binding MarR family transcriptional regulator [Enterococcus lemanii]NLM66751.1 MarR family transcriptional regulator [Enterococcus sp.]